MVDAGGVELLPMGLARDEMEAVARYADGEGRIFVLHGVSTCAVFGRANSLPCLRAQ